MRKYVYYLLFVLLYLTSCTTSTGDYVACLEEVEQEKNEEEVKLENELSPNLNFNNESPYMISIFKDSFRQKELCNINAHESKDIYDEESLSDVVYYITYYIKLSDDFSIPYYSNDCFVILPYRKNKSTSLKISWPDKVQIQDCYVIVENKSNSQVVFKHGASELFSLDKYGREIENEEQSSILLPDENGIYKISSNYFNTIPSFKIATVNGRIFNLSEKIVSFKPGSVYKIIVQNKSNGIVECVLKSISLFNSEELNKKAFEEISYITISYQTNYSSKIASKKIPIGTSLTTVQLPELKRSGYSFAGWYYGNKKITSGYVAMDNLTLSARWNITYYTVSTLNQIDLSKLDADYTLYITGSITVSDLDIIASKIKAANKNITLDLKRVTGISEINCKEIYESSSRFSKCYYLKSVRLPENLLKVGNYAFTYCRYLENVEISEGTKSLGSYPFYNCSSLKSVTIPKTMTSLGYGPFSYCSSLSTINYNGTKAQWNSISKNNWRENAYSYISKVVCTDGVIELNK